MHRIPRALASFAVLGVLAPSALAQGGPLFPGASYGPPGSAVFTGDVTGDGRTDLLAVALGLTGIHLVPSLGGGAFGTPVFLPSPQTRFLVLGDLDHDGDLDLVSSELSSSTMTVRTNDGSGGFGHGTKYQGLGAPRDLILADVNGDANLDVLVDAFTTNSLRIAFGDGAGGFGPPSILPAQDLSAFAVADLNGDTFLDLLLAIGGPLRIEARLWNGAGGFGAAAATIATGFVSNLASADIDNDGAADALWTELQLGSARGNGSGGFFPKATFPSIVNSQLLAVTDADSDGNPDVVLAGPVQTQSVGVLPGLGNGGFGPTQVHGGFSANGAALDDLDGDGIADLAIASDASPWLRGDGAGGFERPVVVIIGSKPQRVAVADLDEDGAPDFAAVNADSVDIFQPGPRVVTRRGDGAFGFSGGGSQTLAMTPRGLAAADVDGDGRRELVALDVGIVFFPPNLLLAVIPVDASGVPGTPASSGNVSGTNLLPTGLSMVDLDGDGRADAVCPDSAAARFAVLSGMAGGAFGAPIFWPASGAATASADPVVADLTGDGRPDVAFASTSAQLVTVVPGLGGGAFAAPTSIPTAPGPGPIAAGDLDRNGTLDLAVAHSAGGITLLVNGGGGAFAAGSSLASPAQPTSLAIADLDGDGLADLALAERTNDEVVVWLGTGGGAFASPVGYGAGADPGHVRVGDADLDGRPDLFVAGWNGSAVFVLPNLRSLPAGAVPFGTGTPGCDGVQALGVHPEPKIGTPDFVVTSTNAPPLSLGLLIATDVADLAGSDPFGIDTILHVDLFGAMEIYAFDLYSDASGTAVALDPLPNDPQLVGRTFAKQAIWVWAGTATCMPSTFGLSSSRGLLLTIGA